MVPWVSLEEARDLLLRGELLLFPTETVFGLGALSRNHSSCEEIFKIKNRPRDNPLIVHFGSKAEILEHCLWDDRAEALFQSFMPGPLTLVLQRKSKILFPKESDTLAVRIPIHQEFLELLKKLHEPMSAPSANLSGKPSITDFESARKIFSGKVKGILRGQLPIYGIESTVVDLSSLSYQVLRLGALPRANIEKVLGKAGVVNQDSWKRSPGTRYKHYSPEGEVVLVKKGSLSSIQEEEAYLGISRVEGKNITQVKDIQEYILMLYQFLNQCDERSIPKIFLEIPEINSNSESLLDRLETIVQGRPNKE